MKPEIPCYAHLAPPGAVFLEKTAYRLLVPAFTGDPEQHDLFLAYAGALTGGVANQACPSLNLIVPLD